MATPFIAKPPKTLTHFTTLSGLHSIVQSKQLWASNVSFLNDRRELKHGLDASLAAIKIIIGSSAYQRWNDALRSVVHHLEAGEIPNTYALCLCARSDVLSQWRGYGGGVQGVSISFDQDKLTASLKPEKARLCRVIYANFSTVSKVRKSLRSELDALNYTAKVTSALTPKESEIEARVIVDRLLPQFKHLGFSEEREYRYVVQQRTIRDDVKFRANGNVLVPYIHLPRSSSDDFPIVKVTVGPGKDQILTKESIELFLRKYGYATVKVVLSDVPYRA